MSEGKKLSPERRKYWDYCVKHQHRVSWGDIAGLWEICQALEADNAKLEADLHNLTGYSEQSDRDAEAAQTIADNEIARLKQELQEARAQQETTENYWRQEVDKLGTSAHHATEIIVDLQAKNQELTDKLARYEQSLDNLSTCLEIATDTEAELRARIAELEANQKRMLEVPTGWTFLYGDEANEACNALAKAIASRLREIATTTPPTQGD